MRRWLPHPLTALLAALVAVVGALALWLTVWSDLPHRASPAQTRTEEALAAARLAAINSASYDYRTLPNQFAIITSELTGPALTNFNAQKADIQTSVTSMKTVATAQILDSGVRPGAPTSRNEVVTLVALTVSYVVNGGAPQTQSQLLTVDMINNGKGWLAQNITPIVPQTS